MSATLETICIVCPNGCHLKVTETAKGITVTGNKCNRGVKYGTTELRDPRRMVTAVAPTDSPEYPCAPVKTSEAIAKPTIGRLLEEIYRSTVALPVRRGDTLVHDFEGTGVDVIFTRSLPPTGAQK